MAEKTDKTEYVWKVSGVQLERMLAALRGAAASYDRLAKRDGQAPGASNAYRDEAHETRLLIDAGVRLKGSF